VRCIINCNPKIKVKGKIKIVLHHPMLHKDCSSKLHADVVQALVNDLGVDPLVVEAVVQLM